MDGGVAAEQGTVTCGSWIRRPENAHLVVLGKLKHGDLPASLQIFTFDRITNSLSPSPSVSLYFNCRTFLLYGKLVIYIPNSYSLAVIIHTIGLASSTLVFYF